MSVRRAKGSSGRFNRFVTTGCRRYNSLIVDEVKQLGKGACNSYIGDMSPEGLPDRVSKAQLNLTPDPHSALIPLAPKQSHFPGLGATGERHIGRTAERDE